MKKFLLFSTVLILLFVVGCIGVGHSTTSSGSVSIDRGLWLRGAEVYIRDLYPGCCPDNVMLFEVGNGIKDNVVREIHISIEPEDDNDLKGYEQLPAEYYDWFVIDSTQFVLQPGESRFVHVYIMVPESVNYSDKRSRCELLVLGYTIVGTTIDEEGNTVNVLGNVPIGIASEWYIETY